jgi:hypothetical protein
MASTPQRELLQQRSDGSRLLDLVFDKAKNAGLLSSNEAVSDIKGRLLALFDAALTVGQCFAPAQRKTSRKQQCNTNQTHLSLCWSAGHAYMGG